MIYKNYKQLKAIEKKNKQRLLEINPNLDEESGIYFLLRKDEEGFLYAYIGQAKHILTRLASHMTGFQRIDLSIKKHDFETKDNPYGWSIDFLHFPESELDEKEKYYIKQYALQGYQMRNKTSGSQGKGKSQIDDYKPSKGYRDGLKQGRKNCSKEIAHLFEKHLDYRPKKNPPTKNQQKAVEKFEEFLEYHKIPDDNGAIDTNKIEKEKYGKAIDTE